MPIYFPEKCFPVRIYEKNLSNHKNRKELNVLGRIPDTKVVNVMRLFDELKLRITHHPQV